MKYILLLTIICLFLTIGISKPVIPPECSKCIGKGSPCGIYYEYIDGTNKTTKAACSPYCLEPGRVCCGCNLSEDNKVYDCFGCIHPDMCIDTSNSTTAKQTGKKYLCVSSVNQIIPSLSIILFSLIFVLF